MRAGSFGFSPCHGKAVDQLIDNLLGILVCTGGQLRVFSGGQDGTVTEDFLYFEQVDTRFDQMSCIAVALMPNSA